MQSSTALVSTLALALGIIVYPGGAQVRTTSRLDAPSPVSREVPLAWAPGWLVTPLRRALADAIDPRERSKTTGAPFD